ncbi:DsbC family protein [Sphingobium sp. V4]|uniref:DsbC family protein n=1 Tax=Sphingobium sp. V4 TaxID=3038927 RepID=UPI0025580A1B|nr:DsbC family protein [Sphingobium sp. V4]WIW89562.1 DsbC family protein [Sphingobium sp. V4]
MTAARRAALGAGAALALISLSAGPTFAQSASAADKDLAKAEAEAEQQLHQTFTNLKFDDFGPAPVKGPIYQAIAGGKIIYYAPESEHILFAAVYDKNGVNVTALAQDASTRRKLGAVDPAKALVIGPPGAPTVIEFTDPDCPYCRALEKFWAVKEAEGKPVRRLVYFVSGIHPEAAGKAEHILCSPDKAAEFKAIYAGATPKELHKCLPGRSKVEADAEIVRQIGISGTPTLIVDGRVISGFQQGELEEFLQQQKVPAKPSP